jgi:hypothetical protein
MVDKARAKLRLETLPLVRKAAEHPNAIHLNPDPTMSKAKSTKRSRGHQHRMELAFKLCHILSRWEWWAHQYPVACTLFCCA